MQRQDTPSCDAHTRCVAAPIGATETDVTSQTWRERLPIAEELLATLRETFVRAARSELLAKLSCVDKAFRDGGTNLYRQTLPIDEQQKSIDEQLVFGRQGRLCEKATRALSTIDRAAGRPEPRPSTSPAWDAPSTPTASPSWMGRGGPARPACGPSATPSILVRS
jgi:hypothetical protein